MQKHACVLWPLEPTAEMNRVLQKQSWVLDYVVNSDKLLEA